MPFDPILPEPANENTWELSGAKGYMVGGSSIPFASGGPSSTDLAPGGAFGALSGPWYIEEQDLTVAYRRVPSTGDRSLVPQDQVGLSGVIPTQVVSATVNSTSLLVHLVANVSRTKSYDYYPTSGYWQPQKFLIEPLSADINGRSYGDVNTGCLGPGGTITSRQKYFIRRPWIEGVDSEVSQTCDAFNYYGLCSGTVSGYAYATDNPQGNYFDNLLAWAMRKWTWDGHPPEASIQGNAWIPAMPWLGRRYGQQYGGYTTAADTSGVVFSLLDDLADIVRTGGARFYNSTLNGRPGGPSCTGGLNLIGEIQYHTDAYCPAYDKNRHDYT